MRFGSPADERGVRLERTPASSSSDTGSAQSISASVPLPHVQKTLMDVAADRHAQDSSFERVVLLVERVPPNLRVFGAVPVMGPLPVVVEVHVNPPIPRNRSMKGPRPALALMGKVFRRNRSVDDGFRYVGAAAQPGYENRRPFRRGAVLHHLQVHAESAVRAAHIGSTEGAYPVASYHTRGDGRPCDRCRISKTGRLGCVARATGEHDDEQHSMGV